MKSAFPGTSHLLRDSSIRNALKPRTLPWLHPPGRGKGFQDHAAGGSREPIRSPSHGPGGGLAEPRNHPHCSGSGDTKGVHPIYPLGLSSLGLWYPARTPQPTPLLAVISSSISRGCAGLGPFRELLEKTRKCFLHRMKPPLCFRQFKCTFPRSSVSSLC